jgi:putative methyltransferase (TIGR04325 family)
MAIFKNLTEGIADRLPWGARKIARRFISFVDVHGFSALFVSRPTFRGVYSSFADVPGSIDLIKRDLAGSSVGNLQGVRSDVGTGLPLLDQHRELLPATVALLARKGRTLKVLDFGGAAGVDFRNLLSSLQSVDVAYCVVDLPEVCESARPLWNGESRISFRSSLPEQAAFDLVYSWSAIHYVPEPLDLLRRFTQYRPRAILIVGSPLTSGKAFVREQLNRSKPFPQWVLSLPEVTDALMSCGYRLAVHAVHEHDYNVDGYPTGYRIPNSTSLLFLSNDY